MKEQIHFILLKAYWEGVVSRLDLADSYGIAGTQAANYFSETKSNYVRAIKYDASLKRYIPDKAIEKHLPSLDFSDYLRIVKKGEGNAIRILPNNPHIPVELHRAIRKAINIEGALQFTYHSLSSSSEKIRTVYPHTLVNSGYRWHLRGWELESAQFKDFNLSRIAIDSVKLHEETNERANIVNDTAWNNEVAVFLVANPTLSDRQKEIVNMDFNMRDGVLNVFCRQALLLYTLNSYLVTDFSQTPQTTQLLALWNYDRVAKFLPKPTGRL